MTTIKRADPRRIVLRRINERPLREVALELIEKYGFTEEAADRVCQYIALDNARPTVH